MTVKSDRCDSRVLKSAASKLAGTQRRGGKGKKTDEGTMMWPPETRPNPLVVADSPEA
jgi:hypothetical protein